LAVNVNKPNILKQVRPYINKRKYKFPVSVDPRSKLAKKLGVIGYPALYIVDKDGTILYKSSGYEEGKEDEYLERLIDYFSSEGIAYQNFEYEKSKIVDQKEARVTVDF
jgi:thioredoxin-related protein